MPTLAEILFDALVAKVVNRPKTIRDALEMLSDITSKEIEPFLVRFRDWSMEELSPKDMETAKKIIKEAQTMDDIITIPNAENSPAK